MPLRPRPRQRTGRRMNTSTRVAIERAVAVKALMRARQGLTVARLDQFQRLGEYRRRWEFRLLIDWYALLHRSYSIKDTSGRPTE